VSQTTYAYDETTPTSTSGMLSHVAVTGSRGNLTTITRLVQGTTTIHSTKTYYDTGMLSTEVDANGNPPTTYTYGTGSCGGAFPTQVTNAVGFNTMFTWDCNGGVMTGTTDPNNQTTSYSWTDPKYWRLTQITYPDGGQKTATYNTATTPWNIVQTTKITGTQTLTSKTIYDSSARVSQQQLTSDPEGTTYTNTTYDADGRLKSVSNPYRSTSESTYGLTSYLYDGLGRTTTVTRADNSTVTTSYSANQTTVTDEAGKQRTTQVDGLGRLTAAWEAPNTSGYNFETDYQYDSLGNLICAVQKGTDTSAFTNCASASSTWRPRSFTYDMLSRLLTATNPESGTITYTYDNNGNVLTKTFPKPNQTSPSTVITTNYSYDALNRLTKKTYTNSTTQISQYAYDGNSLSGCTVGAFTITSPTNLKGHRTEMCAGPSTSVWSYDPMGRVAQQNTKDLNSSNGTSTQSVIYKYYLDGELQTLTYPSGDVVTYTPTAAGRTSNVSDAANNYVAPPATAPMYTAGGLLVGMKNGTALSTQNGYNSRLQPVTLSAGITSATLMSISYNFHAGSGDNGNVFQIINNLDSTRSTAFQYDPLNRIQQANTITTTGANCWGEVYTIDAWGNLTNRAGVSGMTGCLTEPLNAAPASVKNQLSGPTYDAAGDVTNDGDGHTGVFDAESRLVAEAGVLYSYDADGQRMEKSNGTFYWYGAGGEVLAESDLNGNINEEYIFFGGARMARVDRPSGTVHYYFGDHLGSASVITDAVGNIQEQYFYYPYGGLVAQIGSDPNHYKFTGKERDAESGLDYFEARHYASSLGRFMQPDEFAGGPTDLFDTDEPASSALPYADINDPQSLNKYVYTYNNPLRYVDQNGHDIWDVIQGAANAFGSDLFGAGRTDGGNADHQLGQAIGDAGATVVGTGEALAGMGEEAVGLVLDAGGVTSPAGLALNAVGVVQIAQGAQGAAAGATHLLTAVAGGPKAADASTVTSNNQAANQNGERRGPSRKEEGHSVRHSTKKEARETAERRSADGRARHDPNPADGRGGHYHPNKTRNKGSEHHYYPKKRNP